MWKILLAELNDYKYGLMSVFGMLCADHHIFIRRITYTE
jgi:hypothetical protein